MISCVALQTMDVSVSGRLTKETRIAALMRERTKIEVDVEVHLVFRVESESLWSPPLPITIIFTSATYIE